jgi:hypothetical protein
LAGRWSRCGPSRGGAGSAPPRRVLALAPQPDAFRNLLRRELFSC